MFLSCLSVVACGNGSSGTPDLMMVDLRTKPDLAGLCFDVGSCPSGCCDTNAVCNKGTAATACGVAGAMCVDCTHTAIGHACLAGTQVCGCMGDGDCPSGQTCDSSTSRCTGACATAADCPTGQACDPTTGVCSTACAPGRGARCNGGCCDIATKGGTCVGGDTTKTCGSDGSVCSDCTNGTSASACVTTTAGRTCGCTSTADCAPLGAGQACDTTTSKCYQSACDPSSSKSCAPGSCCDRTSMTCRAPSQMDSNTQCGDTGYWCSVCGMMPDGQSGPICISGVCGCSSNADCVGYFVGNGTGETCDQGRCVCSGDGGPCAMDAGCCSGVCQANGGTQCCRPSNATCGTGSECCSGVCNQAMCM